MQNESLAADYLKRCRARLKSLDTLFEERSWSDVVRESQEVVELALKAMLRRAKIAPPRVHDVSGVLQEAKAQFPAAVQKEIPKLGRISRGLRRDRELAFYGSEDLTPSEFYKRDDAERAREQARWVVEVAGRFVGSG